MSLGIRISHIEGNDKDLRGMKIIAIFREELKAGGELEVLLITKAR